MLIGHVGFISDYNKEGMEIINFSVATTSHKVNRETGDKTPETEWHKIVAFGKVAEVARNYLSVGCKVYIEGPIKSRKWQDKEGQEHTIYQIVANSLIILDKKDKEAPIDVAQPKYDAKNSPYKKLADDFEDDDLPF